MTKSNLKGILTVIGGIAIHIFCGNLYLWGNIINYVVSYYHFQGDKEANLSIASFVLPLSFLVQSSFMPLGAYLQKRFNPKLILILGSAIMISAIYFASNAKKWWYFVFFYGFQFPAGIGISYFTPIICGWEWFPENKGLVSGLIVGGYGFGAFIFGFISTALVNPKNLSPNFKEEGN